MVMSLRPAVLALPVETRPKLIRTDFFARGEAELEEDAYDDEERDVIGVRVYKWAWRGSRDEERDVELDALDPARLVRVSVWELSIYVCLSVCLYRRCKEDSFCTTETSAPRTDTYTDLEINSQGSTEHDRTLPIARQYCHRDWRNGKTLTAENHAPTTIVALVEK